MSEGVDNKNSSDLSLGRRPESKSGDILLSTPSVIEIRGDYGSFLTSFISFFITAGEVPVFNRRARHVD